MEDNSAAMEDYDRRERRYRRVLGRTIGLTLLACAAYMLVRQYPKFWREPPFEVDFMPEVTSVIQAFRTMSHDAALRWRIVGSELNLFLLCVSAGFCFLFRIGWKRSILICLVFTIAIGFASCSNISGPDPWSTLPFYARP